MWIERLELVSFGSAFNEKVEFGPNAVNLVEEQTEQAELLIPAAVLAILYGFSDKNAGIPKLIGDITKFRPKEVDEGSFVASMDCLQAGRQLRISRNFSNNRLTVLDCTDKEKDITEEFMGGDSDNVGEMLTKLSQEEFFKNCLIVPVERQASLGAPQGVAQALRTIMDRSSPIYGKAAAVDVLEGYLNQFPYKTIQIKIDFLIHELEQQKLDLKRKAASLEQERTEMVPLLEKVANLNPDMQGKLQNADANEYFQLCLRAAEIDGQVLHLRAQHVRLRSIRHELDRIGRPDDSSGECQRPIEELWKRRIAHIDDYRTLEQELAPKIEEYEAYEKEVTQRWDKLQTFTPEQAQSLKASAETFAALSKELVELKRQEEKLGGESKEGSLDLSKYEEVKRTMQALEPRDANDAKSYSALIAGFRKQLAASEKGKAKAEAIITEIEEQRRTKTEANAVLKIFKPTMLRQPELESAQSDLERHVARIDDLLGRIRNLESRIEALAHRAGIEDGSKLLQYVQDYSAAGPQVHELERLDQVMAQKQAAYDGLKAEFEPFLEQAGRADQEINADNLMALAEDVASCLRDFRSLNSTFGTLKLSKQQLDFLAQEIRGIDEALHELFSRASVNDPANIEASYTEFYGKMAKFHHWQSLHEEITKAVDKYGFDPGSDEIHRVLGDLENERTSAWSRIHELVDLFPEISDQSPPGLDELNTLRSKQVAPEIQDLRDERDGLQRKLKGFFNDYDEQYASVLSMIAAVDRQLTTSRNCKLALELAREVLEQLLMDDLAKVVPKGKSIEDSKGEALPLILDAGCLTQDDLELSLALRFIIGVIAPMRQTILLSNSSRVNLGRFSPILNLSAVPVHFVWRKPLETDSFFQRVCPD